MKMRNKERETCPVCGGKGEVIVSCLIKKDGCIEPIKVFRCSACNGKGLANDSFLYTKPQYITGDAKNARSNFDCDSSGGSVCSKWLS